MNIITNQPIEHIAWVDVETTGLRPHHGDRLLQVAAIVTDQNYNQIGGEYVAVLQYTPEEVAHLRNEVADDYVRNMHETNGLWDALPNGKPLSVVEDELLDFIAASGAAPGTARLGGNSITLDRNTLEVETPKVYEFLHWRNVDMTSIAYHMYTQAGVPYFEKNKTHDALDDIRESIAEARYYQQVVASMRSAG